MTNQHLVDAALAVLKTAKIVLGPKAAQTRVSVVGGLSVLKYAPYRQTKVSRFLLNGPIHIINM